MALKYPSNDPNSLNGAAGADYQLRDVIAHAAHLLPAQGPITVFIHHNTLHAFEDRPFEEAVRKGAMVFGCEPFLSEERYRISDAAFLLAALFLHHLSGEGDFDQLTGYQDFGSEDAVSWPHGVSKLPALQVLVVGGLMLIAAAGKSALVPFTGWLPRAMEGPTSSSAVFYGALSVHLGAYLLLRISPVLDDSAILSGVVLVLGLTTAVVASIAGRVQTDIKSALSFASVTQVGLIVAEIGLGWRYVPLVHIIGHAFLRTLQFVRAPTYLHDHHLLVNALGDAAPHAAAGWKGKFGGWLYRFGLERGYLDVILDRFIVAPYVKVFRWCDALERKGVDSLNAQTTTVAPVVHGDGSAKKVEHLV